MNKIVYLDNAATTKINKYVLEEMQKYLMEEYSNPSAIYDFALNSKKAIEKSRKIIANLINCNNDEVFFTSGGTESDNWAIKGIAEKYKCKGKHIITSKIEHHAVLGPIEWLKLQGYDISYVDVGENGIIDPKQIEKVIREDTILVSVMFANNEIGTIQPIAEIGKICRKNKIIFHVDAVQAFGHIPIDVKKMKIDLLSASGHKIYGPKGIGILYVKSNIKILPFIHGGNQEDGKRAGTYNVPGIIGIGKAAEIASSNLDNIYEKNIRNYCIDLLRNNIEQCSINGDIDNRLPNNISVTIQGVNSESLIVMLSQFGIYVSAGSACTSGNTEVSHVLKAIGLNDEEARNTIRVTISNETTEDDIRYFVDILTKCVSRLR